MATKKKLNPAATALTILALGFTGWAIVKFIVKPAIAKRRIGSSQLIDAEINNEILDANFEIVDNDQTT